MLAAWDFQQWHSSAGAFQVFTDLGGQGSRFVVRVPHVQPGDQPGGHELQQTEDDAAVDVPPPAAPSAGANTAASTNAKYQTRNATVIGNAETPIALAQFDGARGSSARSEWPPDQGPRPSTGRD